MKRTRSQAFLSMETSESDTVSWYNSPKWSDLTIRLSNGRSIYIHKIVLCSRNEYFNKLCGLESRFAESDQAEIELKEDSPQAVKGVLRYIYGCKLEDYGEKTWQYWLDLFGTADKYLEPSLSLQASAGFRMSALRLEETDVNVICEILQTLQDTDRYGFFESFAVGLTMQHLGLLANKQFRVQVYSCKRVMFKVVERLSFTVDLKPVELDCDVHGELELYRKDDTGYYRIKHCFH